MSWGQFWHIASMVIASAVVIRLVCEIIVGGGER